MARRASPKSEGPPAFSGANSFRRRADFDEGVRYSSHFTVVWHLGFCDGVVIPSRPAVSGVP